MLSSLFGRILILLAAVVFCGLQSQLWLGRGGMLDTQELQAQIALQKAENEKLSDRNRVLQAEINDLKNGTEAIEEHARLDLGMVKPNETYFRVATDQLLAPVAAESTP